MHNTVSSLNHVVSRHDILWIIVSYGFQGLEFSVFRINIIHDGHRNLDISIQRFAGDVATRLMQVFQDVGKASRRAEVVDDIGLDGIEDGDRAYFYSPADVLLENFRNDSLRVSPFVLDIGIVQRFGEATFGNEIVQFRSDFCRWQQFQYLPGVFLRFKKSNGLKKRRNLLFQHF